jgi:hypothetical protein
LNCANIRHSNFFLPYTVFVGHGVLNIWLGFFGYLLPSWRSYFLVPSERPALVAPKSGGDSRPPCLSLGRRYAHFWVRSYAQNRFLSVLRWLYSRRVFHTCTIAEIICQKCVCVLLWVYGCIRTTMRVIELELSPLGFFHPHYS